MSSQKILSISTHRHALLLPSFIEKLQKLTIQEYEKLCPDVKRRSLQRDLKRMLDKELLTSEGATNQLNYILRA